MSAKRIVVCLGVLGVAASIGTTATASNNVAASRLADRVYAVGVANFAPGACAGLPLQAIVTASGSVSGGDASELILGGPEDQTIIGGRGDDCIVAGAGRDSLRGDQGTDVCIALGGDDSFHPSCETQIRD